MAFELLKSPTRNIHTKVCYLKTRKLHHITEALPRPSPHLPTRFQFLSRFPFRLFQTMKTPGVLANIFPRFKRKPTLLFNGDTRTTHSVLKALS
jgi:hypothetical protein